MIKEEYITFNREPFFKIAKELITANSKVLDIGAGNGEFCDFCEFPDMYLYEGNLDSFNNLNGFKNAVYGCLPDLPFKDNFFDLIHCSHVVEHLYPESLYSTLNNIDRILKPGGYLVISTPLLWTGFYDDLSHIKPYTHRVFEKYLCKSKLKNSTRPIISTNYKIEKLVFRYTENYSRFNFYKRRFIFFAKIIEIFIHFTKWVGFVSLEKTGYTVVFKKYL